MNIFETIKASVPVRQAAEHYGLQANRTGMACCPFHEDKHPSLKLNEDYYYCFGCGAHGDVIDFTARLFSLNSYAAAQKLAADFGIDTHCPVSPLTVQYPPIFKSKMEEALCRSVLAEYFHVLEDWRVRYAPITAADDVDGRFTEALQMSAYIDYLTYILALGSLEERTETVNMLMQDGKITALRDRLAMLRQEDAHEHRYDYERAV